MAFATLPTGHSRTAFRVLLVHTRPLTSPGGAEVTLRCGKPTYAPALHANGQLEFCNYSTGPGESFGTLREQDFNELWNSPRNRTLRREFLENEGAAPCWTCHFRSDHEPTVGYVVPLRPLPERVSVLQPTSEAEFRRRMEPVMLDFGTTG
jgi:radical SAM protein with 4Fe4S-binding SPASM domain